MTVSFEIPGKPFAKQRPRFSRVSGRAFTPGETVSFERAVGSIAAQHFPHPLTGAIRLTIFAVFEPAASWSKRKTAETLGGHHTQKPDLDNIQKAICDGLNRIAYADDGQIAEIFCTKSWGARAVTRVSVEVI